MSPHFKHLNVLLEKEGECEIKRSSRPRREGRRVCFTYMTIQKRVKVEDEEVFVYQIWKLFEMIDKDVVV